MKTLTNSEIAEAIRQAREDAEWIYETLPRKAQNERQKELQRKHGTPYDFAKAVVNCIGEISLLEAQSAAEKYLREWNEQA